MSAPNHLARCVIILDVALRAGLAANAAAVLALTLGAQFPGLVGQALTDADGTSHPGLIPIGLPVLAAPVDRLSSLRQGAADAQLHVIDFPTAGQQTTDYTAFAASVANTHTADLTYLGIAICGPTKPVRKLTGGLPLLR